MEKSGSELIYWLFSGSFLAAVCLHIAGSLVLGVWLFWKEETLIDWHANIMLAALVLGICGAVAARLLPNL
ncbi:MAG: hypothetical protein H7Y22_07140 [Gemmatimonadaceae bacterium]|nr:hypothetical protein [Gloeobacterales cyanobacterium ES-bin-141]